MIELLNGRGWDGSSGGPKESGEQINWTTAPTDPIRSLHSAIAVGDEMFMAGGFNNAGIAVATFQKYNFITEQWTTLSPMLATGLRASALINVNGDLRPLGLSNRKDAFALTGNIWRALGTAPEWVCYGYVAGWYNGKLYQIGGDGTTVNSVTRTRQMFLEWDPVTDKWTILPNLPFSSLYAVGHVVGTKFWVYGGNGSNAGTPFMWSYDFVTKTWVQGPSHPSGQARSQCFSANIGNRIIVGGGTDAVSKRTKEVYVFDIGLLAWERLKDLETGAQSASCVVYDDKAWIYGGYAIDGSLQNKFFSYDIKRS
ncbi:N-acetylneuraminate epimerase [compost metagenome]